MNHNKTDKLLDNIHTPDDIKSLTINELKLLAEEIREELIEVVSQNGGHLAPNLGIVELTIALHFVFNAPKDKLLWDVGHQGYVHKLLTGRREFFKTIRQDDGCLGFLSREESEYDVFGAGHAGTAISAALGIAAARDRKGDKEKVVAIVGDGSLNNGISLEGLNNVSETTKDFIVILNDNKMSISENVGAISNNLNNIISGKGYNRFKALCKTMLKKIPHGDDIRRGISRFEEATKSLFVPGVIFEELGLRYIGPINGHDIPELVRTLNAVKNFKRPAVLHVITEKGSGYSYAENAPEKFHGLSSFNKETGLCNGKCSGTTFSQTFGNTLCELAEQDEHVVGITAAMASGTGMSTFSKQYPERFYDTGITEEHAVVFAAGLAAEGMKPIVAIYATFLQRSLDCIYHDICLQNLPVIICADRSGIVDDGPTHHGIYDMSFLMCMPNLSVLWPQDEMELQAMMHDAYQQNSPVVIKYPRGGTCKKISDLSSRPAWGKAEIIKEGKDVTIWALGREVCTALEVADILKRDKGLECQVVNTRFLLPFDDALLKEHAQQMPLVTIEDCQIRGGLGSIVDETLINEPHQQIMHFGWDFKTVPVHGTVSGIRKKYDFTPDKIAQKIVATLT